MTDFLQKQVGLVEIFAGACRISFFLQEQAGLVRLCAGAGGIGRTFCRSRWDWLDFLQKQAELDRLSAGAGEIGRTNCGNRKIGQSLCVSVQNWSDYLQ